MGDTFLQKCRTRNNKRLLVREAYHGDFEQSRCDKMPVVHSGSSFSLQRTVQHSDVCDKLWSGQLKWISFRFASTEIAFVNIRFHCFARWQIHLLIRFIICWLLCNSACMPRFIFSQSPAATWVRIFQSGLGECKLQSTLPKRWTTSDHRPGTFTVWFSCSYHDSRKCVKHHPILLLAGKHVWWKQYSWSSEIQFTSTSTAPGGWSLPF